MATRWVDEESMRGLRIDTSFDTADSYATRTVNGAAANDPTVC